MIRACFYIDEQETIRAFDISGHSGFAEPGSDIICAGVSAIAQTVIGTIDEFLEDLPPYKVDPEQGRIAFALEKFYEYSQVQQVQIAAVMYSALVGCRQLALEPDYSDYLEVELKKYSEVEDD